MILRGLLRAETALRVATGRGDEISGTDISVFKDNMRRPFIPGSSFKGLLRAHIESVIRGICPLGDMRNAACDPLDEDCRCLTAKEMKELREQFKSDAAALAKAVLGKSCRMCRLFGSPWLASKVLVKDLKLAQPESWAERRYEVRTGVGIDRDSETAREGVLYDSQVVAPGTEFEWEILIENANPDHEEPLLFLGLREMKSGRLALGGGKSRGLGRFRVTVDAHGSELVQEDNLVEYLKTGKGAAVIWDELEKKIGNCVLALSQQ
jgi:CRISPR-associated RAMP protein (TIGR02581 family)